MVLPLSRFLVLGMSKVLPSGYRNGLRCATDATLTAGRGDIGNSAGGTLFRRAEEISRRSSSSLGCELGFADACIC